MSTTTRPAQVFRAIFNKIKKYQIEWEDYKWLLNTPFTIYYMEEVHIRDSVFNYRYFKKNKETFKF